MGAAPLKPAEPWPPGDTHRIELTDLASRLALEFDLASAIAGDCQDAVGGIAEESFRPSDVVRLQALDGLTQTLAELAGLCRRLSNLPGLGSAPASIADDIVLGDLQRRIIGREPDMSMTDDEPELW
jgi:hypothetical protein